MVALKYAVMMNGVSALIMMKADILNTFETIKIATAYIVGGKEVDYFPFESNEELTPVYKEFKGWKTDICGVREYKDFPKEFKDYVAYIEKEIGCPIKIISVGPDRSEIVIR